MYPGLLNLKCNETKTLKKNAEKIYIFSIFKFKCLYAEAKHSNLNNFYKIIHYCNIFHNFMINKGFLNEHHKI